MGRSRNRLLSSVDLISLLSGSYLGAAVDTTVSGLLSINDSTMTLEERKALGLYQQYLERYPDGAQRETIQTLVDTLREKKKQILTREQIKRATEARENGNLDEAEFHYNVAHFLDPSLEEPKKEREALERQRQRASEKRDAAAPSAKFLALGPDPDGEEIQGLLRALVLRDPGRIEMEATTLREQYRGSPLAAGARDSQAVAFEIRGLHEKAKEVLRKMADDSPSSTHRSKARALLQSPEYNQLVSLDRARTQHRLETVKYVLLGKGFLEKNLLLSTRPLITQGLAGVTTMGTANLLMVGTNVFQLMTSQPISYQPVIDRAVEYIRSHPDSDTATDVYQLLGEAYEDAGDYDRAILYYSMAGPASEEKVLELKEQAARTLLQQAEKSPGREGVESYLRAILDSYPQSSASKDAARKLAQHLRPANRGVRISKKFLVETQSYMEPRGSA